MDNHYSDYFSKQKKRLLKRFDKTAKRADKFIAARYDEDFSRAVIKATRENFLKIIPEIPYIGGKKNQFTQVMVINAWIISLSRAMKAQGKATDDVIKICCEVSDDFMKSFPSILIWMATKLAFSSLVKSKMRRQAGQSQKRKYPADFVYRYVEGDGKEYDWTLEFSECAVNKFYDEQGVHDLKPFCNFFDVTYSKYLNMGINANTTIGIGCPTCELKYKKGGETQIPQQLKEFLPINKNA